MCIRDRHWCAFSFRSIIGVIGCDRRWVCSYERATRRYAEKAALRLNFQGAQKFSNESALVKFILFFVVLFWVISSFIFLFIAGWFLCINHVEKDNTMWHYCRGLWTYGRSRGLYARKNVVACDLWYSRLRLSFHLGGAAVVVISLIGTMVFWLGLHCKGFIPVAGFPLARRFLIGIAFICLCIGSSLFCEEPGRVSVWSLQKWRLRVSVGSYWSDYSTSYRVSGSLLRVCVGLHGFPTSFLSLYPSLLYPFAGVEQPIIVGQHL